MLLNQDIQKDFHPFELFYPWFFVFLPEEIFCLHLDLTYEPKEMKKVLKKQLGQKSHCPSW